MQVLFGEYGGNVNLTVNGDFANVNNPIDLHGMMLGGCLVEVIAGGFGGDSGRMVVSGAIGKLSIGGQEFAIDMVHDDDCDICLRRPRGRHAPSRPRHHPSRRMATPSAPRCVFSPGPVDGLVPGTAAGFARVDY